MRTTGSSERSALYAVVMAGVVVLSVVAVAGANPFATTNTDAASTDQIAGSGPTVDDSGLADADTKLLGEGANDTAGTVVASAGDVNGDGVADVLVGAPRNDSAGNESGAAYVFYGPVETGDLSLSQADLRLTGAGAGDLAGIDVAAGDLDGDGNSDLVVGAPYDDSAGSNAGAVYVVYGSSGLSGTVSLADADVTLSGAMASRAGRSVATVNGSDGAHDLVVGAPYADAAGNDSGATYVLDGSGLASGPLSDGATFTGAGAGDLAGSAVSSAGDFDGDGVMDLVVGAPLNDSGGDDAGAAYLVSGARRFDGGSLASASVGRFGVGAGDNAGYAVSDAGDVNDDGFADVIVGAPLNDSASSNAGAAYVVYGSATPARNVSLAHADLTLRGVSPGDRAGWSVSAAGSWGNCDPYGDVLVGAPYNNSTGSNAGVTYLVQGDQAGGDVSLHDVDATFSGAGAGDLAGWSVSEAADASGDGNGDLLIGAPYNDTVGTDAGVAYLLRGQCSVEDQETPTKRPTKTPIRTKSPTPGDRTTSTVSATPKSTPTPTATPKPTPTPSPTPTPTPTPKNGSRNGSAAVEFINCSAVRIHGDYEGILISAQYLELANFGEFLYHDANPDVVPERAEGTTVIDLSEIGGAALYLSGVQLARDNEVKPNSMPEEIDHTASNPHEYGYDSCIDESRDPDGDGLTSGAERDIVGTDPNDPDTDDDGLLDGQELGQVGAATGSDQYETFATSPDSDGDGYLDGEEIEAGTDPLDHSDRPTDRGPSTEPSVEFLNCTAMEVTGEFDGVLIFADERGSDGHRQLYSDDFLGRDRIEGTTVIDISSEAPGTFLGHVNLVREGDIFEDGVRSGRHDISAENPYHSNGFEGCPDEGEDGSDSTTQTTTTQTTTTTTLTTTTQTTTTTTTENVDVSVEFLDCTSARVKAPAGYRVRYSGYTFVETGNGAAHPNWLDPIKADEWPGGEGVVSTDWFYPDDPDAADRSVLASVAVFDQDYDRVAGASNPDAENAQDVCGREAECEAAKQGIAGADADACGGGSEASSVANGTTTAATATATNETAEGTTAKETTQTTTTETTATTTTTGTTTEGNQ